MRISRFRSASGSIHYGSWTNDESVRLWSDAPWKGGKELEQHVHPREVTLMAPVEPTKIVAIGRNYAKHAAELGNEVPAEPLIFLKPSSSLIAHEESIRLPRVSERVEYEGELGVVIGKEARNVSRADASSFIFGFTCVNDVTARDLQKKDGQWTRAKGFDTFCPCGPWIQTDVNPNDLRLSVRVSGALRQDARTSTMVFNVDSIIAYISKIMTLLPGDLLCTGTPEGVGPLKSLDVVEVEIENVGVLRNSVALET